MKDSNRFRLFFKDGIGVYAGHVSETKLHTHHATEIILSFDGLIRVADEFGTEITSNLVLIPHDVKHRFIGNLTTTPIFIYIDPFHVLAQRLTAHFKLYKSMMSLDLPQATHQLRFSDWINGIEPDVIKVVSDMVDQLMSGSTETPIPDERITKSIDYINDSLVSNLSIKDIASLVHLSESRYAHLFKEQVGIPFRRFVLWSRLQTTVQSIMNENSLTRACYEGGFSDLAHFSKTFMDMFGVSPSSVLKG